MARFAITNAVKMPGVPVGAQWDFEQRVKVIEANTVALLEAAINAWLATLPDTVQSPLVIDVDYQSGAKERALIQYGYFVQV